MRRGKTRTLYGGIAPVALDLCQELTRGGITVVAAGIGACVGAWVGVKVILLQKEFDLVKQRYLEGGVDIVAAHCEDALGIFHHNWARCLQLVKMFRDAKESFDVDQLKRGFLELDSSKFHAIPHHRLQILVRSQVFWEIYQLALAFAVNANAIVTQEIPETIRLKLTTDKLSSDFKHIAEKSFEHLRKLDEKSHKFARLTRELEAIAGTLQTEKLSFKNVLTFHQKPVVSTAIKRLEKEFESELKTHREHAV